MDLAGLLWRLNVKCLAVCLACGMHRQCWDSESGFPVRAGDWAERQEQVGSPENGPWCSVLGQAQQPGYRLMDSYSGFVPHYLRNVMLWITASHSQAGFN